MSSNLIGRRVALASASAVLLGGVVVGGTTAQAAPATAAPPAVSSASTAASMSGASRAATAFAGDLRPGSRGQRVTALQIRLNQLGYSVGSPVGVYGARTRQAVMAVQKVAGLPRTGVYDARTAQRVAAGVRPKARSTKGHVIEIDKARQVLLVVDNGRVSRIYNVSTGNGQRYWDHGWHRATTPSGSFRFWTQYRGGNGWQHGRLGSMYRPMYFNGGIAVHGSRYDIGARPSSHGCVRIHNANMDELRGTRSIALGGSVLVY
ncbi:L,D-transpeptidase family protein [Arsenicicoccus sp. oral taxon 190]|uniref:L,D-transpeptidase family protein n=1 Tax=Arsenicicoccus sp. oral taxon 190 TaxID=1658671 RepID=UPI00067A1942|nr:L,D-transpeptidase family protein [Arsenicicoccus sp. oral taxon 190]AKT51381.1 hypothetical protein ADJ73_08715 [Arsenicicoccus sp. oral taxon 190]